MANNGDALLAAALGGQGIIYQPDFIVGEAIRRGALVTLELDKPVVELGGIHVLYPPDRRPRSDEHTSELQSLMRISYAGFCLKKKNHSTKTPQSYKHSRPSSPSIPSQTKPIHRADS